jgi:hypothetical protein
MNYAIAELERGAFVPQDASRWVPGRRDKFPPLQGAEEFEKGLFFGGLELFEFFGNVGGFATVAQDGVGNGERGAVVHQARVEAETPKRGGAHFVGRVVEFGDGEIFPSDRIHLLAVVLGHGLDDSVAAADVVEEKVALGMEGFIAEGGGNGESAAVDRGLGFKGFVPRPVDSGAKYGPGTPRCSVLNCSGILHRSLNARSSLVRNGV